MATKKEQIEFVRKIYPAAARLYRSGGVHPLFVTAQAALETGWKIKGVGNNIFGITRFFVVLSRLMISWISAS